MSSTRTKPAHCCASADASPYSRIQLALVLVFFLATAVAARGQEYLGTITGTITDTTGAVIKQTKVVATNVQTGNAFSAITTDAGIYTIPLLPIGGYEVKVSVSGFDTQIQHVEVHGGDRLQVDFHLRVGTTSQSVTVTSAAPLLETTTGESGLTVSPAQVSSLPLIGRNPITLSYLAPGVYILPGQIPGNSQRPFDNGGFDAIEINGGRPETAEATIDGLADTGLDTGSASSPANILFVPSPDMTQEFRVQTTLYDAQYGRSGGGSLSVNLKAGTNQFHGVLYDYNRNSALIANYYADDRAGVTKPPFHWNEPGLEIDGPVLIPKVYNGHNKTFFMFGWDEIRTSTPAPIYETVPTAMERQGNFAQSYDGGPLAIYDPTTTVQNPDGSYSRTEFQGNQIPSTRVDTVAAKMLAYIPLPNLPAAGNVDNLLVAPNNVVDAYDAFTSRVDETISPTQHLFESFLYSDRHQTQGLDGFPAAVSPSYLHYRTNYGAHVVWDWVISPTLVANVGVGWNEHRFAIYNHQQNFDLSSLDFPAYVANSPAPTLFPRITIQSYSSFGNAGLGTGVYNVSDNYDLRATFIKSFAKHDLSFGGEIRPMRDDQSDEAGNSTFGFGRDFTEQNPLAASANSGSGFASFLLGYADSGSASSSPAQGYRNFYYALFAQDNWRATDRLSLNFGLRWDTASPQTAAQGRQNVGFDPGSSYSFAGQALHGTVLFPTSGQPSTPYNWDFHDFGPRFGFAYRATSKLVVRGGFGILYSPTFDIPSSVGFSISTPFLASTNNLLTPGETLSNPYPGGYEKPAGVNTNLNGLGGWTYWNERTRDIPRTTQYSLGFEYQLPFNSIFEARYMGQLTDSLPLSKNPNAISTANLALGNDLNNQVTNPFAGQLPGTALNTPTVTLEQTLLPYPQYVGAGTAYTSSSFTEIFTNGSTNYNALQARFEKRLSHGLNFLATYTFQKSLVTGYLNNEDANQTQWLDEYDLPQLLNIAGGYRLPFFADSSRRALKETLGGWDVNAIITFSSGQLYAAPSGVQATGVNPGNVPAGSGLSFNPCTRTTSGTLENCTGSEQPAWYITPPFTLNHTSAYYGGLRTSIPPNVNFSVFKTFPIHERLHLQFRAESFNLTNTPQFAAPDTNVTDPTFGQRTNFSQNNDPRNVQVALRLQF